MDINYKSQYIEDSILDILYRNREEELYTEKGKEDKELEKIKKENSIDYNELLRGINKIPSEFKEIRENIIEMLDAYITRENLIMTHDNEKFYKIGFCDGIRIILEIQKNK